MSQTKTRGPKAHDLPEVVEPGESGYFVGYCPTLRGCVAQGRTRKEARANLKKAIASYLSVGEGEIPRDETSRQQPICRARVRAVYLVSCVKGKRASRAPARDLYCSQWFRRARRYVEATRCPWFILSAEHGLVAPEQVVEPYEKTLRRMSVADRRAWAERVKAQMEEHLPESDRIVVLAGRRYREFLMEYLERRAPVEIPMEKLRSGEQLSWLRKAPHGTSC